MTKTYKLAEAVNILHGIVVGRKGTMTKGGIRRRIREGKIASFLEGQKRFISDETLYSIVAKANKKKK